MAKYEENADAAAQPILLVGAAEIISGKYKEYVAREPMKMAMAPGKPKTKTANVRIPAGKKGSSTPGAKFNMGLREPICIHQANIQKKMPKT